MIKLKKNEIVAFVGDSITDGNRIRKMDLNHIFGHGFAHLICSKLALDNCENTPKFINKGVGGESSSEIYARYAEDIVKYKPDILNILMGVNDAGKTAVGADYAKTVDTYFSNLENMIADVRAVNPEVKIIVGEPFYEKIKFTEDPYTHIPHPYCEEYFKFGNVGLPEEEAEKNFVIVKEMQKRLPGFCKEQDVIFVPYRDAFENAAKKAHMSYFIWDNVHPTMVGHRLMADRWFEVVEKEMAE